MSTIKEVAGRYKETSGKHWFQLAPDMSAWKDYGKAYIQQFTDAG